MKLRLFSTSMGLLAILTSLPFQHALADVLVLKNGDRITGEVTRIWDSEVTIEPEYSDEFSVDLPAVDYIESDRDFEIELASGRQLVASFGGADGDGNQIISAEDESVAIQLSELFELEEPEETFEWDSHVELAASLNKGNTNTATGKVRADSTVKYYDHRHIGEVTFFREELADVVTKKQDLFRYNYNWLYSDQWFFSGNLAYERDPIIELDSRVIVSAGVGLDIWDTPRRTLNVQAGGGFQQEQISGATTDSTVATWTLRYRQDFFNDDVDLFHNHTITSNLSGRTNTSYRTSTGLGYEITDLLTASISLDFNYETHPIEGATNEDIAILFGFGAEF
jgi:putative salt-induced outer membrane protein YdiY